MSEDDNYENYDRDEQPLAKSKKKQIAILQQLGGKKPLITVFLVDIGWWNKFNSDDNELPGDIDNSPLVTENGEPREGLKQNEHYYILNANQWKYLCLWYKCEKQIKAILDDDLEVCFNQLNLGLTTGETFKIPGTCSIKSLKNALCSALEIPLGQTVMWRLPKECDPNNYNVEEDLFPLLEEDKKMIECGLESGDFIKIDTESIQKEDTMAIAAKIKKELTLGGDKETTTTTDDERPQHRHQPHHHHHHPAAGGDDDDDDDDDERGGMGGRMGGMGGGEGMGRMMMMGGLPMMGGGNMDLLNMLLRGAGPMKSYEEMEREEMEKAIKESLQIQKKEEEEKKKKEDEERKRKEEIENERKRIQEFAKEEETKKNDDDEDYEPIDENNISDDDDDDEDGDDEDDE